MNALRIGWSTPWNARSAIADFAGEVAHVLAARGHEVTILRSEAREAAALPPRPGPFPVFHMDELDDEALHTRFDVVVAHVGNHHPFHDAQVRRLPGNHMVGVFHDLFLAHLAAEYFHDIGDPLGPSRLARELYGEEGMPEGQPFWTDLEEMVRRRPMLEWLATHCIGAVAHSSHYAERLRACCPGPVAVIPLAFVAPNMPPAPPQGEGRLTVAVIGHANANKRVDQVIMAIGSSVILRGRCRLRVIGQAPDEERTRLEGIAAALGVEPPEFTGWVDDDELRRQLRDVHVIACLRNPVLEGASASVVTAMASGRPTLVTDHGCYAEIPADAVLPCRPEAEALDAMRHLERLVADPAEIEALGERARMVALTRHAPTAYADALIPFLQRIVADRPRQDAAERIASTLAGFGLPPEDPARQRAATLLKGMGLAPGK
ncbi:glycosyltransferase family 4 protein [Roseomonas sp. SSH11]|uniref:Glycosyltransferase family 4 protein n=1 Tax=Pararoseomonas baculiformis TaxID=2820812 RepID=A0ABS4AEH9_9PROT|nr:glycosyltransferase family 4 protein [Pararoseomonas baculiformis]MBP0445432.1 glycosyltransferase family 4 protein [Pararoseomonas baculiformis]